MSIGMGGVLEGKQVEYERIRNTYIESFLQHLIGACDASFTLAHSAIHGD